MCNLVVELGFFFELFRLCVTILMSNRQHLFQIIQTSQVSRIRIWRRAQAQEKENKTLCFVAHLGGFESSDLSS